MSVRTALRSSLPYAVAIIGGFLVAYLVVAFVVFPSGVIPGNAKVPNVAGLMLDDAAKELAAVGFTAQRTEERFHGGAPKGTVLEQDPRAGVRDAEGTTVRLVVSAGQEIVRVPAIVGMSQTEAEAALEGAGFEMGNVAQAHNSAPSGQVVESKPAPGAKVAIPATVSITVSDGAAPRARPQ
ncbi:MAG: PASTA domain-containing protein [Gemmatimonadaceae bacterium]